MTLTWFYNWIIGWFLKIIFKHLFIWRFDNDFVQVHVTQILRSRWDSQRCNSILTPTWNFLCCMKIYYFYLIDNKHFWGVVFLLQHWNETGCLKNDFFWFMVPFLAKLCINYKTKTEFFEKIRANSLWANKSNSKIHCRIILL